jgi:hypothetical protein
VSANLCPDPSSHGCAMSALLECRGHQSVHAIRLPPASSCEAYCKTCRPLINLAYPRLALRPRLLVSKPLAPALRLACKCQYNCKVRKVQEPPECVPHPAAAQPHHSRLRW